MTLENNEDSPKNKANGNSLRRRQRRPGRMLTSRRAAWSLIAIPVFGLFWYFVRPSYLVYEARGLLATDPAAAAELMQNYLSSFPDDQESHVLWAHALLRSGRWQEAIGCFSQIDKDKLTRTEDLLRLADDARSAKVPLLAVLALEAVGQNSPDRAAALRRLLTIRNEAGDFARTITAGEELTRLRPDDAFPWQVLASIHERQMALPEAINCLRQSLQRESRPSERIHSLRPLVRILIQLGERSEARKSQDEICQNQSLLTSEDHINEARLLRLEGNIDRAQDQATKILDVDRNNVIALEIRGTILMERADYAAAEADFRRTISLQQWNKQAHYKLAQILTKTGQTKEAAFHFAENRRLLDLSSRFLHLQQNPSRSDSEQQELISLMQQLGLKPAAEHLKDSP